MAVVAEEDAHCCPAAADRQVCIHMAAWLARVNAEERAEDERFLASVEEEIRVARAHDDVDVIESLTDRLVEMSGEDEEPASLAVEEASATVRRFPRRAGRVVPVAEDASAVYLAGITPGAGLAEMLDGTDVDNVTAFQAVEIVAAYRRLEAWAHAQAAVAAARLSDKPEMSSQSIPGGPLVPSLNGTADDLAMRLGTTRGEAGKLVRLGKAMAGTFSATGEKLLTGEIDARKAEAVVSHLWHAPDTVAWLVQEEILDKAPGRTPNQLTRDITKALIAVDAEDATIRFRRAAAGRKVSHVRPRPDGMGITEASGPGHELAQVDLVLDAAARSAKAAGDTRTRDQLRFDALVAMAQHALHTGWIGPSEGAAGATGNAATVGAAGEAGMADVAGHRGHPGAADAPGSWLLPPPTAAVGRPRGAWRLAAPPGGRLRIDVTVPLSVLVPDELDESEGAGAPACDAPTDPPNRPDRPEGQPEEAEDEPPPVLMPEGCGVAELSGYGPLVPEVARALALGGTWRRILTDRDTGAVLDVGRKRYRPPAALAELVRRRDGTCVAPGCTVPAAQCQIDHGLPWSQGGRTDADNLAPLCDRDHPLKTGGLFAVTQPAPGVFEWTTPSGHHYRREIDGTVVPLDRPPRDGEDPPY